MKFYPLILPFLLASCSAINSSPKEERAKTEMSLRKMRTDLDEIKHDLNSNQMELHILEGKMLTQETSLSSLKEQAVDNQLAKLTSAISLLSQLEKKILHIDKKVEEAISDIRNLSVHANETNTALTQYQDKLGEVETNILTQNQKIQDISTLKNAMKEFLKISTLTYTVKSGDTLEKVAKTYRTSPDAIKRINRINEDAIFPGQELLLPQEK